MKKALICGVSGQDGAYLAKLLLAKGYKVFGTSRDAQINAFSNLNYLGIQDQVNQLSMTLTDFRSVIQVLSQVKPDEVYNLAGQSSVGLSFDQPVEAMESISVGTLNLLESIRFSGLPIKLYNAGSGECFGDTHGLAADENTPFHPRSPYAVAKSAAFWQVANYREAYNLHASTGILFNHESPIRPDRFVTRKIIKAVCSIALGKQDRLLLGDISICRDWGWSPEYVEAMWLMLQQDQASDYVIATGQTNSLQKFISIAFESASLNWQDYVETVDSLLRPSEISSNCGNPTKAFDCFGWKPKTLMKDVVEKMLKAEIGNQK